MTYDFKPQTWAEVGRIAQETETWLIDGMIGASTTLIYGEAKSGKSFLVSNLISALATGKDFLGKPVPQNRGFSVAVCWTDDQGHVEYRERIETVLGPEEPAVSFYHLPIMRSLGMWQALYDRVISEGNNVVVIDNLTQALNGSINQDEVIRDFFEGVRLFTRAGLPVIIVGHSTDKAGMNGFKSDKPMGSATISQSVRWKCFVRRSRKGNMTLRFNGNAAAEHEMTVNHGAGARFTVLAEVNADQLESQAAAKRDRDAKTLDDNAKYAAYVVEHCQGKGTLETARMLAEKFGKAENSFKTWLRPTGKLGVLVSRTDDGRWQAAA